MPRAMFLDFGNTLVNEDTFIPGALMGVVDFVRERAGLDEPRSALYQRLRVTPDGVAPDDPRRMEPMSKELIRVERFRNFAADCGLAFSAQDTAEMMAAYDAAAADAGLIDGTIETLQWLRSRYRIALVSNGYAGFVHATLDRYDLRKYLDRVYVSQEVNAEKPSPEFYGRAADALGVRFQDVLMAGDGWEPDVAGAKRLGMMTCWINRRRLSPPDPALCDFDVSRLADLPPLLDGTVPGASRA